MIYITMNAIVDPLFLAGLIFAVLTAIFAGLHIRKQGKYNMPPQKTTYSRLATICLSLTFFGWVGGMVLLFTFGPELAPTLSKSYNFRYCPNRVCLEINPKE